VLREQRSNALQKLQQKIDAGKPDELKQDMQELAAVDRQLAQGIYDEVSQRLEKERVEREAAFAKKERDRERALAKHERLLVNRGMSKILSAANKADYPGEVTSAVDRDLQEAAQYGIAAAEVAVRRKSAEAKAQIEERIEKQQADHRKKNKRVNITV
ncbi:MAG: hypothetical protein K0Q75_2721, partial [Anaerospora sp.]|nr:hypothetical protein [Anaerospora sp.]